jgi:hypothetical protein
VGTGWHHYTATPVAGVAGWEIKSGTHTERQSKGKIAASTPNDQWATAVLPYISPAIWRGVRTVTTRKPSTYSYAYQIPGGLPPFWVTGRVYNIMVLYGRCSRRESAVSLLYFYLFYFARSGRMFHPSSQSCAVHFLRDKRAPEQNPAARTSVRCWRVAAPAKAATWLKHASLPARIGFPSHPLTRYRSGRAAERPRHRSVVGAQTTSSGCYPYCYRAQIKRSGRKEARICAYVTFTRKQRTQRTTFAKGSHAFAYDSGAQP